MTAKKTTKSPSKNSTPAAPIGPVTAAPAALAGSLPPGNSPPSVNAPAVPKGWKKRTWPKPKAGTRPKRAQVENTAGAIGELTSSTSYVQDFGNKAPDPQAIAASLANASGWRDSWAAAQAWLAYCSDQRRVWEEDALTKVAALKPAFDYASANDPSIAKKYAATKQLLGAPSAVAQRGAAVRKAKAKAKAAKGASPAPATATTTPAVTH